MATSRKPAAPKPAAKPAATPAPVAVQADQDAAAPAEARVKPPSLKIKELVDRVAAATGGKKKGVKEMVEATLREVGEALSRGEDLNLPGFGRSRVARSIEKDGNSMMTLKVKRGMHRKHPETGKEPLADDGEDS